jgi:hypothetical protein
MRTKGWKIIIKKVFPLPLFDVWNDRGWNEGVNELFKEPLDGKLQGKNETKSNKLN